jgi:hypothetical protein
MVRMDPLSVAVWAATMGMLLGWAIVVRTLWLIVA